MCLEKRGGLYLRCDFGGYLCDIPGVFREHFDGICGEYLLVFRRPFGWLFFQPTWPERGLLLAVRSPAVYLECRFNVAAENSLSVLPCGHVKQNS